MKQNGAVYFYNLNSERGRQIRMLCLTLGLKIRVVDRAQYTEAIGAIAGVPGYSLSGETYKGEGFEDEMLILKGFTGGMPPSFRIQIIKINGSILFHLLLLLYYNYIICSSAFSLDATLITTRHSEINTSFI